MPRDDIPPCFIRIDKEGRWYHNGTEMIHRDFIRLFYEHLEREESGRYLIRLGDECCYVEVEDTPFVVLSVTHQNPGEAEKEAFRLSLSDDSSEKLTPETLSVGDGHVLYCRVKDCSYPARFARPAYYQLAEHIMEEKGSYFLPLNGKKYKIPYETA
ncbi:MAG: DUF1285 domain-containing protein [Pseudomonadota bacterium]